MLNVEKVVEYYKKFGLDSEEQLRKAAEFVNKVFPDAKGFVDEAWPPDYVLFRSEGSAYAMRFSNLKISYVSNRSDVLNPKYWFDSYRVIDVNKPMLPTYIAYKQPKNKKEAEDDWRKKAAAAKKAKADNVDELLAATQVAPRASDSDYRSDSNSAPPSTVDSAEEQPEQQSEPEPEPEPEPIKIRTLEDIQKLNREKKSKPKKAVVKKKKQTPKIETKGIW